MKVPTFSSAFLWLITPNRKDPSIAVFLKLIFWYKDLMCRVRWGESLSQWYSVLSGVRQGGVLSPDLYCLYVDDLIRRLEVLNVGCYISQMFLAALLYADDMALLAPSVKIHLVYGGF